MKCLKCTGQLRTTAGSRSYTAAGLADVILCGIEIRQCETCGSEEIVIPALESLHWLLAREFAKAPKMSPAHMRFVRKHMGYSRARLADLLHVSFEDVDAVESGRDCVPEAWHRRIATLVREEAQLSDFASLPPPKSRPLLTTGKVTVKYDGRWAASFSASA